MQEYTLLYLRVCTSACGMSRLLQTIMCNEGQRELAKPRRITMARELPCIETWFH